MTVNSEPRPTMSLTDHTIIVTGAAQGIGAVLAAALADHGANVVIADVADPSAIVSRISSAGRRAIGVQADVTRGSDCAAVVDNAVKTFGGLDGLVCNAALFATLPARAFDEIDEAEWDRVMAVNVKGPWLCARAAAPAMATRGGGSIVLVSSNRVFHGYPMLLHYDASKGAVLAMGKSLARELGPQNIRVNTLAPGLTMSEGVLQRPGIAERAAGIARSRALARDQQPSDLVGATAFFLSGASAFITGQSLIVDGGGLMH
jgi:NAD(P)-dependent dehydrogenase (short-subunit alcohol dehydrogenase family)